MQQYFDSYLLVDWANRKAREIKKAQIQDLHSTLGETVGATTANRVIELMCSTYNHACDNELLTYNPARRIKKFALTKRERFLNRIELQKFLSAVYTLRYDVTQDFLLMCLWTGVRRSNVASMRWDHICLETAMWFIPETKNGDSQYQPLTDQALEVLARRKERDRGSEWVFPSHRSPTGHLTKPEEAWKRVKERSGLSDVRIHDLRRTLASWEAIAGVNLPQISETLHHKTFASAWIYTKLNKAAVRAAMELATKRMLGGTQI